MRTSASFNRLRRRLAGVVDEAPSSSSSRSRTLCHSAHADLPAYLKLSPVRRRRKDEILVEGPEYIEDQLDVSWFSAPCCPSRLGNWHG